MKEYPAISVLKEYLLNFILAFFAFSIAYGFSFIVKLPANHTYQVSNVNLSNGYNPEDNYARILFIIIFGFLVFWGLKRLSAYDKYFRAAIIAILLFGTFSMALIPSVESNLGNIDTFHQGEQLSPAQAYGNGKKLYTGMFVLHGAGDDVVLPHLALHLPGTKKGGGIGSYFFVKTTFELLSSLLFFIVLATLFRSTALFVITSTWFALTSFSIFYYIRDIFTWALILLITYLLLGKPARKARSWLMVLIGFIASSTYFYEVDRGFIATLMVALTAAIFVFFIPSAGGWKFNWRLSGRRILPAAYTLAGAVAAQLIGLLLLGGPQYGEFLKTTFITIPKYEGYLFNYPLPAFTSDNFLTWLPVLIALIGAIMLYMLVKDHLKKNGKLTSELLLGIVLYVTSVIFLRSGYGRPDFGHVAYSTPLLFLAVFYIARLSYLRFFSTDLPSLWPVALVIILLFYPVQTIPLSDITGFSTMKLGNIITYLKLPRRPDSAWLNPGITQISDYIKQNSSPKDPLFVFTQQPIYYYLTDRPNPSRFYISWFADPGPLSSELLKDLQKTPPKIILYSISNGQGWDMPDGYTMAQRSPQVNAWIKSNYHKQVHIGSALLLEK